VGKIRRRHAVEADDVRFLKAHTNRMVKITVPGPFTMSQQAQNDFYPTDEAAALDYAVAVNEEIRDLFAAGADVVQIDEPYMQARPEKARQFGLKALEQALDGIAGTTAVHICFGYAAIIHERPTGYSFLPELAQCRCNQVSIETAQSGLDCSVLRQLKGKQVMVGCIDLSDPAVETPETVVARIERALQHIAPEDVILAPDCGMKYLPREVADGKLRAMVAAAGCCGHDTPRERASSLLGDPGAPEHFGLIDRFLLRCEANVFRGDHTVVVGDVVGVVAGAVLVDGDGRHPAVIALQRFGLDHIPVHGYPGHFLPLCRFQQCMQW
jgi:hypothetical protein